MDIKIDGITEEIFDVALEKAQKARNHILNSMNEVLSASREELSDKAPQAVVIQINTKKIRDVIGKGGETIQAIQAETNTSIGIGDAVDGMANVEVFAEEKEGMDEAMRRINLIAYPPTAEVGETYEGKVKNIVAFGAFLEILPGIDALLHISEIDHKRVEKVDEYMKPGDVMEVKVIGKDPKNGKLKISRKALIEKPVLPSNE